MPNTHDEACEWSSELTDDSMKELFISETMYCTGNRRMAIDRIEKQIKERLPIIKKKAIDLGGSAERAQEISDDLRSFADAMRNGQSCEQIDNLAKKIDTKHVLPAYRTFCKCIKKG